MKQCLLRRGATRQVAWLPMEFATAGRYIRLKDEDGWLVVSVHGTLSPYLLTTTDGRDMRRLFESLT